MTDYKLYTNLFGYSAFIGVLIWAGIVIRLLFGIFKKQSSIIKSSIKYLVNSLTFLYVAFVYFNFAIVVQAAKGETRVESYKLLHEWVDAESIHRFVWALYLTLFLTIFNLFYQYKIEKIKNVRLIILLSIIDLLIMSYGIFIGGRIAIAGLTGEIERQTF